MYEQCCVWFPYCDCFGAKGSGEGGGGAAVIVAVPECATLRRRYVQTRPIKAEI